MKTKIFALVITAAGAFTGLQAQDKQVKPTRDPAVMQERASQRDDARSRHMAGELGLTEDQTAAMIDLDRTHASQLQELRSKTSDREELQARAAELNNQRDERLKHLLTPEQFAKLMEQRKSAQDQSRMKEAEMQKAAE